MCDKSGCGDLFSENEEGWSTAVNTVQKRRENGTRYGEQQQIDLCPSCASGGPPAKPRIATAITAGDQAAAAEREDDHVLVHDLQRQVTDLRQQLGDARQAAASRPNAELGGF